VPTLRIESPLVERVYQSDYVALAASLGEIGWTVVEPRRRYEERGGIPPGASLALEVAIHLGEAVAALGLEEIVRPSSRICVSRGYRRRRAGGSASFTGRVSRFSRGWILTARRMRTPIAEIPVRGG